MVSLYARRMLSTTFAAAICCLAASGTLSATNVVYRGSGTFSLISGPDIFQLRNEPFSFHLTAPEGLTPTKSTASYAEYSGLPMTAVVTSAITQSPLTIKTTHTAMTLFTGHPTIDIFQLSATVAVVGKKVTVTVKVVMKKGTLTNDQILPFTHGVTLTPTNATVVYSDGTNLTTLGMNGNFGTVVKAAAPMALPTAASPDGVFLHSSGAQTITVHADGTKSIRSVAEAVELGASSDKVMLQFYASGVGDASDVQVQIGGEDARVLFAGPAGHFEGLDEVTVLVPRSLSGRGDVEVTLTVDGQAANPVRIHVQ